MEPLLAHSEREWILIGMAECCAAKGFEASTVADVCAAAGVTEERFAQFFDGKTECLGAAMERLVELALVRLGERVATSERPWAERLQNGVSALLGVLAERQAFARLALLEAPFAGGRATILYEASKAALLDFLDQGKKAPDDAAIPLSAGRGALAGVEALLDCRIASGQAKQLDELEADITFMLAVPYLGRREAARLGETSSRARGHLRAVA